MDDGAASGGIEIFHGRRPARAAPSDMRANMRSRGSGLPEETSNGVVDLVSLRCDFGSSARCSATVHCGLMLAGAECVAWCADSRPVAERAEPGDAGTSTTVYSTGGGAVDLSTAPFQPNARDPPASSRCRPRELMPAQCTADQPNPGEPLETVVTVSSSSRISPEVDTSRSSAASNARRSLGQAYLGRPRPQPATGLPQLLRGHRTRIRGAHRGDSRAPRDGFAFRRSRRSSHPD